MIQVIFNFNQEGFSQKGSNFVTVIIYPIRSQEVYSLQQLLTWHLQSVEMGCNP